MILRTIRKPMYGVFSRGATYYLEATPACFAELRQSLLLEFDILLFVDPVGRCCLLVRTYRSDPIPIHIHFTHRLIPKIGLEFFDFMRFSHCIFFHPAKHFDIKTTGILNFLFESFQFFGSVPPFGLRIPIRIPLVIDIDIYASLRNGLFRQLITLFGPSKTLNLFAKRTASYQLTVSTGRFSAAFAKLPSITN